MHVAQVMLVQADTIGDAMDEVRSRLEEAPEWSDWHNANYGSDSFAGRWEGTYFGEKNEHDALRYSDDPALAENTIFEAISSRRAEIEALRERVRKSGYDPLTAEFDPEGSWNMDAFALQRLIKLLEHDWNSDSAIYDLEDWNASLASFRKRVADAPDKQWLVVVDFHF